MMPEESATPVPIHDILPPVGFFPYPVWMVVAAAIAVLAVVGFLVWFFFLRKRKSRVTTATERAMKRIDALRGQVEGAQAYPFSIEVSEVLRRYIEESQGLLATRQTTREFLDAMQGRTTYTEEQFEMLSDFLELADMIKFARMTAGPDECRRLLSAAEGLIQNATARTEEVKL